jgi:hypothetical protein
MTNAAESSDCVGELIAGRYEVRVLLGVGGMARVYAVTDLKTGA